MNTPTHHAQDAYHAQYRAGHTWAQAADKAIKHLATTGQPFTSDDVRALIPPHLTPTTPNAYGGLFSAWATRGLIKTCGIKHSTTATRRSGLNRQWIGATTYQDTEAA